MSVYLTLTDTFGGEANFAWARRDVVPEDVAERGHRAVVRYAKQWARLNGRRCQKDDFGDAITLWPRGLCQVLFIEWRD